MLDTAKKPSSDLEPLITERDKALSAEAKRCCGMPLIRQSYSGDEQVTKIRDREIRTALHHHVTVRNQGAESGATEVRGRWRDAEVADAGEPAWLFPVHGRGVPVSSARTRTRPGCFAGEGDPFRTNARFKFLSRDMPAKRLSTRSIR